MKPPFLPSLRTSFSRAALSAALLLGYGMLCNAATVSFEIRAEPKKKIPVCNFNSGKLSVDFRTDTFWTISDILWEGKVVGQKSGGTGSVVTWDGKPVGTVHRSGDVSEKLISVDLIVDGKTIPLVTDSKPVYKPDDKIEGNNFVLVKKSNIGPLLHEARFTLSGTSPSIQMRHDYQVTEEITPERFKGYRYAFMHMMPIAMSEWVVREVDDKITPGTLNEQDLKKERTIWTRSIRGVACYAPSESVGIAYLYLENYPGNSHLVCRPSKDIKFRGILFDRDTYAVGEKLSWSLSLIPFTATSDTWQAAARHSLGL